LVPQKRAVIKIVFTCNLITKNQAVWIMYREIQVVLISSSNDLYQLRKRKECRKLSQNIANSLNK